MKIDCVFDLRCAYIMSDDGVYVRFETGDWHKLSDSIPDTKRLDVKYNRFMQKDNHQ